MKHSFKYQLKDTAGKVKLAVWPVVHKLAWPAVWLRRRLRPHKLAVCRWEGNVTGCAEPLAVLCGGVNPHKEYLRQLIFENAPAETESATVRLIDAFRSKFSRAKDCGLVVLETNEGHFDWLNDGGWFFIPAWVRGEIRLPLSDKTLRSDSIKSIRRQIRKREFEYVAVRTPEDLKEFHNHMYMPYITQTFGAGAVMHTYDNVWGRCEEAGFDIVMIRSRSRPDLYLAGSLIIYEAAKPRLWSFGVRDGSVTLVREGVLSALYLFIFEYLHQQGFTKVNIGGSRPFLRDGVLTTKRRLSQTIVGGTWEGFALRVLDLKPATRAFLLNNPFFFRCQNLHHGAAFSEGPLTVETVTALDHANYYPGMHKLLLYFFNWNDQFRAADLPPEVAARVEVHNAAELVSGHLRLP
jgi:hypothetical protein